MGVRGDMESRGSLYRTRNGESPVVYNAQIYNAPLLPFEKQLIESIGATEEEYRYLVNEALKKGKVRPAGYEHVPDIRAAEGATAQFLISLAVGLTLSVVSYLLTPKPRQPKGQQRRELGDINEAGRYNPTWGFDSQAELATYNDPIPIIFGKATYTSDGKHETGGLLVSPRLVWSRMFSQGTQQAVKMAFIVGEQGTKNYGIEPPDLSGIFIGNNPLDSIYKDTFAFYWCKFSNYVLNQLGTGSRLLPEHLEYGTRGSVASGDQSGHPDVLNCPADVDDSRGFSAAYSPSNNTEFGCYAPIANGSAYRVNWRTIPMVDPGSGAEGTEHSDELAWERIKIAGWYTADRDVGADNRGVGYRDPRPFWHDHLYYTQGTGRNYSRRMGILNFYPASGSRITATNDEVVKIIETVEVGDQCEFFIMPSSQKLRKDLYDGSNSGVKVEDINSEINAQRAAADDALQLGELFQIGKCTWQVVKRSLDGEPISGNKLWTENNDKQQVITLKCIDNNEGNDARLGIVCIGVIYPENYTYTGEGSGKFGEGWINDTNDPAVSNVPGPNFFPLLRHSKAILKNTRKCRCTEIGIRSKVFQSLNGLCNFQTLLTPEKLHQLENDGIAVSSGTVSAEIKRSSFFCVKYRDAEQPGGWSSETEGWQILRTSNWDGTLTTAGLRAVDQYNWIRVRHSEDHRYEYQIRPIAGAGLKDKNNNDIVYRIVSGGSYYSLTTTNSDVNKIEFSGQRLTRGEVLENKEFFNEGTGSADRTITTVRGKPIEVTKKDFVAEVAGHDTTRMTAAKWVRNWGGTGNGPNGTDQRTGYGRGGAIGWELFGNPNASSTPVGGEKTVTEIFTTSNFAGAAGPNRPVKLKITAERTTKTGSDKPSWWTSAGITHNWVIKGAAVEVPGNGVEVENEAADQKHNYDWQNGDVFYIQKTCSSGNLYAENWQDKAAHGNLTYAGIAIEVTGVAPANNTGRGKSGGVLDQVFDTNSTSIDALTLNETKTYDIVLKSSGMSNNWKTNISDSKKLHLKFHGTVIDIRPNWTGRYRGWRLDRIEIVDDSDTSATWNEKEIIDFYREGADLTDTLFWSESLGKLGWRLEITNTDETRSITINNTALRAFEEDSQLSDISFYGNLVQKSNESSPEHIVTYINEFASNEEEPKYDDMSTAVLAFKASRSFNALEQVRVWLKEGIKVTNLHPDDSSAIQSSNLFTDLVYYLLTDRKGGVGETLGRTDSDLDKLIDKTQLGETSRFLRTNKLFFNGALSQPVNVRSWIAEKAPNFLCDFILSDGRFTLKPALPVTVGGAIDTGSVTIKQIFTSGNILEDTFKLDYIDAEERINFKAALRYRTEKENQLPGETTITVRWGEGDDSIPTETFDLTDSCTTRDHAVLVGKYFVSLRRRVTHTCSFSTTPYGLDLAPGDYIRVITETSPYSAVRTGTIAADGTITLATSIENGDYSIIYYTTSTDDADVEEVTIRVNDGVAQDWSAGAAIFSLVDTLTSENVYRVEQLTLNPENTVEIVASEFPCDNRLRSLIAQDITSTNFHVI